MRSTTYTYAIPCILALSSACASTHAPPPLTALPPPEFATPAGDVSDAPPPPPGGDTQFVMAEPKAKTSPTDETVTTLQPQKASKGDMKTQHIHAAQ